MVIPEEDDYYTLEMFKFLRAKELYHGAGIIKACSSERFDKLKMSRRKFYECLPCNCH